MRIVTSSKGASIIHAMAAAAALALTPMAVSALTVSSVQLTDAELGLLTVQANPEFDETSGTRIFQNVTGTISGARRSPFINADPDINNNAANAVYSAIGPGSSGTYRYATVQHSFSMIWGSPDRDNTLTFFLGTDVVAEFIPVPRGQFDPSGPPIAETRPAFAMDWLFEVTDTRFDSVKFESSRVGALEFASVGTTPVPLPAAGWMLVAGLAALGAARRRSRRKAS